MMKEVGINKYTTQQVVNNHLTIVRLRVSVLWLHLLPFSLLQDNIDYFQRPKSMGYAEQEFALYKFIKI